MIIIIAKSEYCSNLNHLILSETNIDDDGLIALS